MIAPDEIVQALYHAVNDSFGISEDEAIMKRAALFGFSASGSKITGRLKPIVNQCSRTETATNRWALCVP